MSRSADRQPGAAGPLDVSVIVASRNGREFLRGCLDSLSGEGRPGCTHEIVVADNASGDGSVEMVRAEYPQVRGVFNETDLGFTASNNRAVETSASRHVMLLNNDTIVPAGAIDRMVAFMDATPDAAGVGARLVYPDGSEQYSGRRFPSPVNALFGRLSMLSTLFPSVRWYRDYVYADELAGTEPFEVDWISHAGAMYRREAWMKAGGLEPDMYYWNEGIFSLKLQRMGLRIFLHPQARIVHYEGHGSGRRPWRAWRQHHRDFARGSYRFYCVHRELGPADPRRLVAWTALQARSGMLSALDLVRTPRQS